VTTSGDVEATSVYNVPCEFIDPRDPEKIEKSQE